MTGIIHFETFLISGILLNLTPGNDTIFILSRSLANGRKAGILSALGIATGSLVHTTLASLGLSMIISNSIWLFNMIKFAGVIYLFYLGIKMLLNKNGLTESLDAGANKSAHFKIYRDAFFTNLLNPKVALFYLSFLPQFIAPGYEHSILPFLLLGITFTATGTTWCLVLAFFSTAISGRLRKDPKISYWMNKLCGMILIALSLKIAFSEKPALK